MQRSSFIPNRTWLNKRSRAPAYTSQLVTVPAGYNLLACLTFFGCSPVTRVELELNLGVKVVACWRGDQVIWAPRSTFSSLDTVQRVLVSKIFTRLANTKCHEESEEKGGLYRKEIVIEDCAMKFVVLLDI